MALVLHHSRARGTAKLVLIGIANHDGDGGAWPSIATLARYAGCSDRAVQRALRELLTLREVAVYRQEGGPQNMAPRARPNRYDVLVTCPPGCDRTKHHKVKPDDPEDPGPGLFTAGGEPGDNPPDRVDAGVTPPPARGDAGVTPGVTLVSPEPPTNPATESKQVTTDRARRGPTPATPAPVGILEQLRADLAAAHAAKVDALVEDTGGWGGPTP